MNNQNEGRSSEKVFRSVIMVILVAVIGLVLGCASTHREADNVDPWEGFNRKIYAFNDKLDDVVLKPVAETYEDITPQPVRNRVTDFFANLSYVNVILNDFLQGKVEQGVADTTRLVYNSVFGIGGLFDVASHMGLPPNDEDFGQTLGVWGFGEGAYLMLPVFGPSTLRDAPDLGVSALTSPLTYVNNAAVTVPLAVLDGVDTRARASGAFAFINEAALDPYIFMREAYLQRRTFLIYDSNPPQPDFFEEDFEE